MDYRSISVEAKKMKQGMSYSRKEKTIIMNVFKYFRSQHPDKTVTEIVRRTAKATGCSEKSIFCFRKEEVSPQGFKEPSKTKIRKNINTNNRLVKYDKGIREEIRNIIYDLKNKNIVPSLSIILKNIISSNLPSFSIMTLRRLLCDMGFYYEKNGNKSILVEKGNNKKDPIGVNKPTLIKTSLEPTKSISTENFQLLPSTVPTTIANEIIERTNPQLVGHTSDMSREGIAVKKFDGEKLQSYSQVVHQTHRIQALGSYQENHFGSLGPPSSSHVPMMFPPRMPPYHLHSSVSHSYPSNMDLHLKRQEGTIPAHYPQLPPHNVLMH